MEMLEFEGRKYALSDLSETAKLQFQNLQFVNEQLLQKNNELQIALTAKIGYSLALKREMGKPND